MDIPDALVEEIRRGRVVLLFGAGASIGARKPDGSGPPGGNDLRDALADRFLGGKFKTSALAWVAELSISETDLATVQEFIVNLLVGLAPAPFHLKLATFRWRGLASTNYDDLIETIYRVPERVQTLVPIRSDADTLDDLLRAPTDLALLKLHGCVTRARDKDIPFILTTDQYVTHRQGRARLFATLKDWGAEHPIVFVGQAGQDPDLRELLLELSLALAWRPRFYLITPTVDDTERRLWESKRVTVLDGTFQEFLVTLDTRIDPDLRPVFALAHDKHPLERLFKVPEPSSALLLDALATDLEYVHPGIPIDDGDPRNFYRGFGYGWYPVVSNLDVRRNLTDRILLDIIARAEDDRPALVELYTVLGEAGAGKSVFLRRVAWEATIGADVLCLFLRPDGVLRYEALREIFRVTQQRMFLFVDTASVHAQDLAYIITAATRDRVPLTVLTAERHNAWNVSCERLLPLVTDTFPLRYLSHGEIDALVKLLRCHDSLGPHLTGKTQDDCIKEFEERAGRQLLVALHEATVGLPFEEIILHEYNQIEPPTARHLYLTVCVLNRLKVEVRAGLIARVHGIRFEDFASKLFAPLEHVVHARQHSGTQDYLYSTRHPEIAQIVFDRVLNAPVDRYNEYAQLLRAFNLAYSTDRTAFRGLLRAKALHDLFPSFENVQALFDIANDVSPRDAYLHQQQANYERIRPNGNQDRAFDLLQTARALDPRDLSIVHSLAELTRARAERADHRLHRDRLRNEARSLLGPVLADPHHARFARVTLVKLALDDLRDALAEENSSDKEVDTAIRTAESHLERAQQQFPDVSFLLTAEAEFARMLSDDPRALKALEKAFAANRRDPYIASRLARLLQGKGDLSAALDVLTSALESNRGDKQLNYQYATALRSAAIVTESDVLLYHYRRAFTKWDTNLEAQFWFARFAFDSDDENERNESKLVFRHLREAPMAHEVRVRVRDAIGGLEHPRAFTGRIVRKEYAHGFIERDGLGDSIFCHKGESEAWEELRSGLRVQFGIGFSFAGPVALNVILL